MSLCQAVQYALACLICMCENTPLNTGCSLFPTFVGKKGCEIWSVFQEQTVGSFYLRAMQGWPLATFWTLCSRLLSQANASKGRGWEGAGGRSRSGSCTARSPLNWAQERQCPQQWPGWAACWSVPQRDLESSQECSWKLLPCLAGCKGILRGRFGRAWKPLPHFMIGAACKEKLSFFPRACRTSFTGPVCCGANKVYHERGCDVSACWCSWFVGRVWMWMLRGCMYCPGHLQKHLFFSETSPYGVAGLWPLTKHRFDWWLRSCFPSMAS